MTSEKKGSNREVSSYRSLSKGREEMINIIDCIKCEVIVERLN